MESRLISSCRNPEKVKNTFYGYIGTDKQYDLGDVITNPEPYVEKMPVLPEFIYWNITPHYIVTGDYIYFYSKLRDVVGKKYKYQVEVPKGALIYPGTYQDYVNKMIIIKKIG